MAINTALLVAAPMLQDVLIDNVTGLPMSNGVVTMYQDTSRTTFKNWYYQSGTTGSYTYLTLPNPLTLSGVGTIQDGNGNDVIPYYYPYDESTNPANPTPQAYYVTVVDSDGQSQFTRQNFPFLPVVDSNPTDVTLRNYLVNNVFWRNNASPTGLTLTNTLNTTLAPSAHDGFSMPDLQFFKNAMGAVDTITFNTFDATDFLSPTNLGDVTPEYYLNFNCSVTGSETSKYIQIPITLHLKTLKSAPVTFTIWSRCNNSGGMGGNLLKISRVQFTGTGTVSPMVTPSATITMPDNGTWLKTVVSFSMQSIDGVTIGNAGDDAYYLQISYPVGVTFNIDIAKPCLYIGNTIPSNECTLYDEVDSIILTPRTGDIRQSLNSFYPFGWVPMNDGTIGNGSSNSTNRANVDTWQLFNLLWSLFQPYDTGANSNPIAQMYTSAGAATNYGGTAIADFNANKALALTKMMGQVLLGSVPLDALLPATSSVTGFKSSVTFTSSGGLMLVTSSTNVLGNYLGGIVTFAAGSGGTLPTSITANTLYYVIPQSPTTFFVANSFANAISANTVHYVGFTNAGTPPNNVYCFPAGSFEGEYSHTQLGTEVGAHVHPANPGSAGSFFYTGVGGQPVGTAAPNISTFEASTTGTNTPNSTPFNIVQPSTYMNFYIKL